MYPFDTKFLVADDMSAIRDLVKGHLKSMGFKRIVEADNGELAYKILEDELKNQSPIEFVISDWNMPKMTGLDFLKKVRASSIYGTLPFILLTSESEREQVTEAVLAGVSQYIVKPFTPKMIEDKIKSVWEKNLKK
ncbi:MAG TPA: response regulator [Pseudobdellovibrionaceae bacterium]|nr:response regulator [Pseudobdellovibrionaceae bacterium]